MSDSLLNARRQMVEHQLRRRGIRDERVLAAMERVPRHWFVDAAARAAAYDDRALPIDCEQTISQPYIVALMTEALELDGGEHVLEVGTGCGYQAAVLAMIGAEVYSIERHAELARQTRQRLNRLEQMGIPHIEMRAGDGLLGWPDEAPFDRIIVTAAGEEIPPALWEQLREGGILVAPLGAADEQTLEQIRKIGGKPIRRPLVGCRFVPLLPDVASN
jgi:protein-L-isoaspartate(D-aspartate) O-methyltransferase